jgi:hypothetical protein
MRMRALKYVLVLLIVCGSSIAPIRAQQDQKVQSDDESTYGSKFFDQLRTIFGRFRDMDLQRVFQEAQPIQCSELVGRKGEWRPVAFFNEDRKLGDWFRESIEEVKADLAVYTFKGKCSGDQGTVQVISEFPTDESIAAYNARTIRLNEVDITVNDPVNAALNPSTMAYTFELPYLFLRERKGTREIYSFIAPDRNASYAPDVSSRWECKMVSSKDVTYRFLICRTTTVPRRIAARNRKEEPSFGSSAFFILSDGMEAQSSVKVLSGDGTYSNEKPAEATSAPKSPARPVLKRDEKTIPAGN